MLRFLSAISTALFIAACDTSVYDEAPGGGRFEGSLLVMWVGPGDTGSGDGRFVYVPDTLNGNGLKYIRDAAIDGQDVNVIEIEPEWMYTDGGSIPRVLQPFRGLNPWGYAPAYMIHDWLFVARKCLNDGKANAAERKVSNVTFRESYEIMAETLKTLERTYQVSGDDLRPSAITLAVSSGISRNLWTETGACREPRISDEHRAQIEARLAPRATARRLGTPALRNAATLVTRIDF